jgi:hypothetical protein
MDKSAPPDKNLGKTIVALPSGPFSSFSAIGKALNSIFSSKVDSNPIQPEPSAPPMEKADYVEVTDDDEPPIHALAQAMADAQQIHLSNLQPKEKAKRVGKGELS